MPPTDFRFNAQTSYSPLLQALATAPAERAKLAILQEQNQRQRLSDLLTNISDSAKLARTFQIMGATKRLSQEAGGQGTVGGDTALINPEGFGAIAGQLPAAMTGLNAAFPSMQPPMQSQDQSSQSQSVQSQTPGSIPISDQEGVINPAMIRNKMIMKTLMGEPKQITEPNTGLSYDSYGPGMNIPTFNNGQNVSTKLDLENGPQPGVTYAPGIQKLYDARTDYLNKSADTFEKLPTVAKARDGLQAIDQLKANIGTNIPAAQFNTQAMLVRAAGVNRLTQVEIENEGGDPGLLTRWQQAFSKANSTGWNDKNRKEIGEMTDIIEQALAKSVSKQASGYISAQKSAAPQYGSAHEKTIQPLIADITGRIKTTPKTKTAPQLDSLTQAALNVLRSSLPRKKQ